ncbi:MAG: MBL fold metallo-hydrolase [Tenuifilaceae bacterium]
MNRNLLITTIIISVFSFQLNAQSVDTIKTNKGNLLIHFIGHGTLMFEFDGKIIHIDPYSRLTDYDKLPKADLILITHHHGDHLDSVALANIYKDGTPIYWTEQCQKTSKFKKPATIIKNGDKIKFKKIKIEVVPAYNIVNVRQNGTPYHPKGEGFGYILNFGNQRVYVAGDTENIPEMNSFGKIDISFLPANLPYTMNPEMLLDAAKMLKPRILYPYHYGKTDMQKVQELFKNEKEIEFRLRKM